MCVQKLLHFLFIFLHISYVALEECKAVDFPPLPNFYTATLMYNVANKERFNIRLCVLKGNCSPRSESGLPPVHDLGKSFSIVETIDDRRKAAFLIMESEFDTGNGTQEKIREKFVWNAEISGVKNFIQHQTYGGRDSCLADNTTESSVIDWLFGFNQDCTTDQQDCSLPSVGSMLHAAGNYTWGNCTTIRGVKTNKFVTNWHIDAWSADLKVSYFWSDKTWQSTAGTGNPAPIRCELEGSAVDPISNETIFIMETIDFMDFLEVEPGPSFFQPPRDMFCEGRVAIDSLPGLPNYYEYGSELIFHHKSPSSSIVHKIISPRKNWYDHDMRLARVDYKPIDFEHHGNVFAGRQGVQTDIQDFMAGVSYQIDKTFGNCSIVPLKDDNAGDLEVGPDGRIQMSDPMHMFHMDQKFAYNGLYMDRGIDMGHFIASTPVNEDDSFYWNTLVTLTASQYLIQDDGSGERLIPAKVSRYPKTGYNDLKQWVTTNIYGFSKSNEQFQSYDITPCFEEDHKMNLLLKMSWRMDMDLMAIKEFQRFARAMIAVVGKISPLRVQQIEVIVEPGASEYDLIFTIVDGPPLDIGVELPDEAKRPIKEVKQMLEAAVNARTFVITVPVNDGGAQGSVNSTASKLIEIDARPGSHSKPSPHVSYVKGYTSGDMAGLAFGMIFGGFLLAGTIYFFALRNNVRAGIPVMRGFDNPLQGLTNLGK